ncbi:hypothetical protein D3C76_882010 [compost metagenome]
MQKTLVCSAMPATPRQTLPRSRACWRFPTCIRAVPRRRCRCRACSRAWAVRSTTRASPRTVKGCSTSSSAQAWPCSGATTSRAARVPVIGCSSSMSATSPTRPCVPMVNAMMRFCCRVWPSCSTTLTRIPCWCCTRWAAMAPSTSSVTRRKPSGSPRCATAMPLTSAASRRSSTATTTPWPTPTRSWPC